MENIISGSIHTHSEMSQFDGANTPKALVNKFSEMGVERCTIWGGLFKT